MGSKLFFKKGLIDPETGEYIVAVAFIPQPRDKGFAKVYELFERKLVEDLANGVLTGAEAKLLLWFLAKTTKLPVQADGWIAIRYEKVAEELKLHTITVAKAVRKLIEKGYLEQFAPRQTLFRLKPDYVYKGVLAKLKETEPDF